MVGVLCEAKDTGGCTVQVQEIRPETGFYGCLTKMSKGLNVNGCNNVNTRFLLISVSTCSARAISSGHAGHYLPVFWDSVAYLREA